MKRENSPKAFPNTRIKQAANLVTPESIVRCIAQHPRIEPIPCRAYLSMDKKCAWGGAIDFFAAAIIYSIRYLWGENAFIEIFK